MTASNVQLGPATTSGLKRELKVVDAAAFSVGLIGPVGGMALLGAGAVAIIGRAAIWAFVFALVAVSLTAYSFTRLARYIAHSGSVYALVGITLGCDCSHYLAGSVHAIWRCPSIWRSSPKPYGVS